MYVPAIRVLHGLSGVFLPSLPTLFRTPLACAFL